MIVLPSLETGGTERQVVLLVEGLVKLDSSWLDRLEIVVMRSSGVLESELPSGVKLTSLGVSNFYDPRALRRLRQAMVRSAPSVVYSLLAPANVVAGLACTGLDVALVWGHRSQTLAAATGGCVEALRRC